LFSREHGRGLDFICDDDDVTRAGGVHVVQTFLSVEESEEVQIRGRTARQTNPGTYSLVLLKKDLDIIDGEGPRFAVDVAQLAQAPDKYVYLNEKRKACCASAEESRDQLVKNAESLHRQSQTLQSLMLSCASAAPGPSDRKEALSLLSSIDKRSRVAKSSSQPKSVMLLIDYSSSMTAQPTFSSPRCIDTCIDSAVKLFEEHMGDQDYIALTLFSHKIIPKLSWRRKHGNEAAIKATIRSCNQPIGATAIWDAVKNALDTRPAKAPGGGAAGPYWIILLTDGADVSSKPANNVHTLNPELQSAYAEGSLGGLVTIGVGNSVDAGLQQLVDGIPGDFVQAQNGDDIGDAFECAAEMMARGSYCA
jgi:hypothetical protein